MSLLNLQHFQPVMLFSLARTAQQIGPSDEKELAAWLSPLAFGLDADEKATQRTLRDLIGAATTLGVLSEKNGKLSAAIDSDRLEAFKAALRSQVLDRKRNKGILKKGDLAPTKDEGAEELTWALTWMLSIQATLGPFSYTDVERIYKGQRLTPWPFQNDTRYPAFMAWAQFLGFGWTTSLGSASPRLIPDPTVAVADCLDVVFGDEDGCFADDFVKRVGAELPVLDEGKYRAVLDLRLGVDKAGERQELSEPLSLALLRLRERGVLRLEPLADSAARTARLNQLVQSFQWVARGAPATKSRKRTPAHASSSKATK